MKLDLNVPLLGQDGKPIGEDKLNILLSNLLAQVNEKVNVQKFFDWSIKLFNDGVITIDKADKELLEKFIIELNISTLAKGRLLEVLKALK